MADTVDLANSMIDRAVSTVLKQRNTKAVKIGAENCLDCGEEVPMPRRELGFSLCLMCAQDKERKKSLFA